MKLDAVKKVYHLYQEAATKIFDGVAQLIRRPKFLSDFVNSKFFRTVTPYVVLAAAAVSGVFLSSLVGGEKHHELDMERKAKKALNAAMKEAQKVEEQAAALAKENEKVLQKKEKMDAKVRAKKENLREKGAPCKRSSKTSVPSKQSKKKTTK